MSENQQYDIAIVGCGPAGLSAAINAKIRNKSVLVFGTKMCSLKMHQSPWIDNYLGFYHIGGEALRQQFLSHARAMEVEILPERVDSIFPDDGGFSLTVKTDLYRARSVVLATGVVVTKYLTGEQEYVGRGVSYCATCDGPLYRGKKVAVIGYDQEGEEEANYLSEVAGTVYYLPQYKDLGPLERGVTVVNASPKGIRGLEVVTGLVTSEGELAVEGVFILRPMTPTAQLVQGLEMENGLVKVNRNMETNIPGIFAAGDVTGRPFQLMKATGEGQVAGLNAASYVSAKYGAKPVPVVSR